jgi:hypothetical protein
MPDNGIAIRGRSRGMAGGEKLEELAERARAKADSIETDRRSRFVDGSADPKALRDSAAAWSGPLKERFAAPVKHLDEKPVNKKVAVHPRPPIGDEESFGAWQLGH